MMTSAAHSHGFKFAVRVNIQDFLWRDKTGLPVGSYTEDDVMAKTNDVFLHVFWAYPTVPSPYRENAVAA